MGFSSYLMADFHQRYSDFCSERSALISDSFVLEKGAVMIGQPRIIIAKGAHIEIGEDVLLDSSDFHYHLNAYGRIKLIAGAPGAKIHIGRNSRIHSSCIHAELEVSLGERCLVAANCQIMDASGHRTDVSPKSRRLIERDAPRPVQIGDDVWLGTGVVVLPGVSIGSGAVIGANSVVASSIPENSVAVGAPAKVIRTLSATDSTEA